MRAPHGDPAPKECASESIHRLKCALEERQLAESEGELAFDRSSMDNNSHDVNSENAAWKELQHSQAVNQLKILLQDQERVENEVSPSRRKLFYCEELSGMKDPVEVVELENEKLLQNLKLSAEHIMREQTLPDASEKLRYQEKVNIHDAQIQSLRKDLLESQKTWKDLEGKLSQQKSLASATNSKGLGGLCLKCAQHEAVLSQTHSNVHIQTIERLTKERDELMDALVSLRQNMKEMQQRESSACEQVKHAVQMAEEANLEKTKALVRCEQLKGELEQQKYRLGKELAAQLNKRSDEKEALREEMKKERDNLAAMVTAMSENVAMLEAQVERTTREKNSLLNQLEESQHQLAFHEMEMNKVCGEMRYQLNQTKMKKDEAEKELREYRTKTIRELEIKDQKIEKLGLELNGNKQRLEQAQQDVTGAREECLKLTELLSKSEHQLHLTRLQKESIQHSVSNEAKARALQAQQREQELTQKMQQMEAQHEKTVSELDSLLTSQNTFITKLKEEYCVLARKLEQKSEKYRSEVNQLSQEKEYLHGRLEKMQKQNDELDQQCVQHGRMHERMKSRLQQLDKHCQATAQQLVELLNKQNQLFKEKQLLTEEVQFLRTQEKIRDAELKHDTDGTK